MSKIDDLIAELCPDGVAYFELQEVFDIKNGYTPSKSKNEYWENGTLPWFRMDDIRLNGRVLSDSLQHITPIAVKGKLFTAYSIIIATSATIGEHALLTVDALANQRFTFLTRKIDFYDKLDMKFVFYYCFKLDKWCNENTTLGNFSAVDMTKFRKFRLPIPPLPIQEKIVRILDKFTTLEAELEAELEKRKKQYEYYRDSLLFNLESKYEEKKINDVCIKTENISWNETNNSKFNYIDLTSVNRDLHVIEETILIDSQKAPSRAKKIVKMEDIIFGTTRPTLKRYCVIPKEYDGQICSTGFCVLRANKLKVLPKYLYYHISSAKYYEYMETVQKGSAYPAVSDADVKGFKIPVPPLEEQECIVAILDRFDTLVNDITQGLPAEIEARRKQYEYYRDKLLTFKEKES